KRNHVSDGETAGNCSSPPQPTAEDDTQSNSQNYNECKTKQRALTTLVARCFVRCIRLRIPASAAHASLSELKFFLRQLTVRTCCDVAVLKLIVIFCNLNWLLNRLF